MQKPAPGSSSAPGGAGSRLSLLSLSLLAAISAVMLTFAPALAVIVALSTLLYTSAAGTPSSPDDPILKARCAIHASVTRAGGLAPEYSAVRSDTGERRTSGGPTSAMAPSPIPRAHRADAIGTVPVESRAVARVFPGSIPGDRAPPPGSPSEFDSPSESSESPALALREPDVLIDPSGRRRPASTENFFSVLILSAGSSANGQACAQGSLILTPIVSALRI